MNSRNSVLRLGVLVCAVADSCGLFVIPPLSFCSTEIRGPGWRLAEWSVRTAIDGPSET